MITKLMVEAFIALYDLFGSLCPTMPFSIPTASTLAGYITPVMSWGSYVNQGFPVSESLTILSIMAGVYTVEVGYSVVTFVLKWLKP